MVKAVSTEVSPKPVRVMQHKYGSESAELCGVLQVLTWVKGVGCPGSPAQAELK